MKTKSVKIGELEIPSNYWELDEDEKRNICLTLLDGILHLIDKQVSPEVSRIMMVQKLIESSIETNISLENYEICQVLSDMQSILNE